MCFVSWYSSGTENATKPNAIASSACFSPIATEGAVRQARQASGARRCRVTTRSRPAEFGGRGRDVWPLALNVSSSLMCATPPTTVHTSPLPTLLPMTSCA